MNTYKIIGIFAVLLFVFSMLSGCYYDESLPEPVTSEVSFSQDVISIFDKSCNFAGCHNVGGAAPDLTAANAYNDLFDNGYIDLEIPENSELYQWMLGNRTIPMPIEGANASINATILAWIQQGAKDN